MLEGQYPGKSHVTFLRIIDLNPNDDQCIYSTLKFIEEQSAFLNIDTPVITFDQSLWLKATDIIFLKHLNIVCRLGGFHLMMSFLGSIGKLMEKSIIEEAIENIYGPNAVIHMLNGKAYSRSIRGHLQLALTVSLLTIFLTDGNKSKFPDFQIDEKLVLPEEFEHIDEHDLKYLKENIGESENEGVELLMK